jgi:hypothetical protein
MQPSKHPSASSAGIAWLPTRILALVAVAGSASLFTTFWNDAWHSDLGRDQATIPPHLLLYGSVAMIGGIVVARGLSVALSPTPAGAHDPGQGRAVAPVTLIGTSDGHGSLTTETPAEACSALTPGRVIALPAGKPDGAGPPTGEAVSGIVLYALGALLLALILLQVRGVSRTPPARSSSLGSAPIRE